MKRCFSILITLICVFTLVACSNQTVEPEAPNAKVPAIMHDGKVYFATDEKISVEIDESAYLGTIETAVKISEWPQEDRQTNHSPYLNSIYALYEDGVVLLLDNEWIYFELRE